MLTTPRRKANRLHHYDYSQSGVYFVTICAKDRACIFSMIDIPNDSVGASIARPLEQGILKPQLTKIGSLIKMHIEQLPRVYSGLQADDYVIMPNHVHILISINLQREDTGKDGRAMLAPTGGCGASTTRISRVVQQLKGSVTKKAGRAVWQKSFHDHVVRDEKDLLRIIEYIQESPAKWMEDRYYSAF
jgi:REP element-mobilizing transposase RayT